MIQCHPKIQGHETVQSPFQICLIYLYKNVNVIEKTKLISINKFNKFRKHETLNSLKYGTLSKDNCWANI